MTATLNELAHISYVLLSATAYLAAVVLSVILALGDNAGIYSALRQAAPQLGFMRFPIKFIVLLSLALPLLAAFGVRWMDEARSQKISMPTLATVAGALGILILGVIGMVQSFR